MNQYNLEFSEDINDFDYSYGEAYFNDFSGDMTFSEQACGLPWFAQQPKYEMEPELKQHASVNKKLSFDPSWNSQVQYESFNDINVDKRCNSVDAKKDTEEAIIVKETTSQPSRACSDTNISVSLNEEQHDDCVTLDQAEFVSEELSPEFEYECKYGDLNAFVDKLLSSNPAAYFKEQGIDVDEETIQKLLVNKRKRKTKAQKQLLESEYKMNPDWSKPFMQTLAGQLNMSAASIYKWHWDQKNKDESEASPAAAKQQKRGSKAF